jgi:2'-5' RNA ligase
MFNLDLSGMGAFPNIKSPRVLWVGIENSDTLKALQEDIERSLVSEGFEKEDKPFTAHLTLGRFRSRREKEALINAIKKRQNDHLGQMSVKALSLMKSDLHPSGAKYTRLFEASLRDKNHTDR